MNLMGLDYEIVKDGTTPRVGDHVLVVARVEQIYLAAGDATVSMFSHNEQYPATVALSEIVGRVLYTVPDEPPDGYLCPGTDGGLDEIMFRRDDAATPREYQDLPMPRRWWSFAGHYVSWPEAVAAGANPARAYPDPEKATR